MYTALDPSTIVRGKNTARRRLHLTRAERRSLVSSLSFRRLHPQEFRDPHRVAEVSTWTLAELKQADLASTLLATAILRAAIFVKTVNDKLNRETIVRQNSDALVRRHPPLSFEDLDAMCENVRGQSFPVIARRIGHDAERVIARLRAILDDLSCQGFVGSFVQRSPDVAAYRYGRSVLTDTVLSEQLENRTEIDRSNRDWVVETHETLSHKTVRREKVLERHTHIARKPCHWAFPADHVAKPDFVEQLIPFVPDYLHGTADVVTTDDYRKSVSRTVLSQSTEHVSQVVKRHQRRRDLRRAYDPCITLFSHRYAIVGWIPEEVYERTL